MSARVIPLELEPPVLDQLKARRSLREVADWLRDTHGIVASYMSVHRLAERLRSGEPDVEAELTEARSHVGRHLRTLEGLAEQFADLSELAQTGTGTADQKPDLEKAANLLGKQSRMLDQWFRVLARYNRKPREGADDISDAQMARMQGIEKQTVAMLASLSNKLRLPGT